MKVTKEFHIELAGIPHNSVHEPIENIIFTKTKEIIAREEKDSIQ